MGKSKKLRSLPSRFEPSAEQGYWRVRLQAMASGDLVATLRAIDGGETYAHCVRVGALTVALARHLGLAETREAYEAGLYHDLGKIAVPLSVLLKPGALSDEERSLVELHAEESGRLLMAAGKHRVARHAAQHHERIDGTGYPHGHAADCISLLGQIVAVADVYDALTHDRPYRQALPRAVALGTIRGMRGTKLSAAVVEALEAVLATQHHVESAARLTAALALLGDRRAGQEASVA